MKIKHQRLIAGIILTFIIILAGSGLLVWKHQKAAAPTPSNEVPVSSYDTCIAAGNPILESYPTQCVANGKSYTNPNEVAPAPPLQ